ncbi:MAG: hypothetical protein G01um10143_784 [Parcubacteria group bacterium Gr01-1014_3]|nr:MAG: hypothetical protein G01um10143_784 [Parcubacteria group bacterium Gr01-1014_3]
MSDDVEVGDQGMTMEECEHLIEGLKAKNGEQEAELVKLRRPSIFKRIFSMKLLASLVPILIIAVVVSGLGLAIYQAYDEDCIKPHRLADEAAQGPTLTDEQLVSYVNARVSATYAWDKKRVLRVYVGQGEDVRYIHLDQETYDLIKTIGRVDVVQLLALREMKRKLREKAEPIQGKPLPPAQDKARAEY